MPFETSFTFDGVDYAIGAREASAPPAVLARNDQSGEVGRAQPLDIGEREGGSPVVLGGRLGDLARDRRGRDIDVVGARVEDHGESSAAMAGVKSELTIVEASSGLPMSPGR